MHGHKIGSTARTGGESVVDRIGSHLPAVGYNAFGVPVGGEQVD